MIDRRVALAMARVRRADQALANLALLDPDYERPHTWCLVRDFIADVKAEAEAEIQAAVYRTTPWD